MKIAALFMLFALSPAAAHGQPPRVGNGGGVWTCEDEGTRQIRWLRFVDLFEAENEFGFRVEETSGTPWEILKAKKALIASVSPELASLMEEHPVNFRAVLRFLPKTSGLTVIEDAAIRVRPLPESCPDGYLYYGQLANFTFDGRLLISSKFFNDLKFTDTERGALLVHEAIYKALREGPGDKNSSRVRQIVGVLFSGLSNSEKARKIDAVLMCDVPTG